MEFRNCSLILLLVLSNVALSNRCCTSCRLFSESPGKGGREGDPAGVRSSHDPVQGAEAAGEPGTAEV